MSHAENIKEEENRKKIMNLTILQHNSNWDRDENDDNDTDNVS